MSSENTIHVYRDAKKTDPRAELVKALWLDFRIGSQYANPWVDVESRLWEREALKGVPVPLDDDVYERLPASFRWMERVKVPSWFYYIELGYGTNWSIERTLATMCRRCQAGLRCRIRTPRLCANAARRKAYEAAAVEATPDG